MNQEILLCLDYDESTGIGHISRSRAFIEAVSLFSPQIYISSRIDPVTCGPKFEFLQDCIWLTQQQATQKNFSMIYVDTYDYEFLESIKLWQSKVKVLLLDDNYSAKLPSWAEMIIDIERSSPRDTSARKEYLWGDLLLNSEIVSAYESYRSSFHNRVDSPTYRAAVNFGGSTKVTPYLQKLLPTFTENQDISFTLYCPTVIVEQLKAYYLELNNVEVVEISSKYLSNLSKYDLLITNSGTSFLEGLYMDIPMIIFNLFSNANSNFSRLRRSRKVLFSGSGEDLDRIWYPEAFNLVRNNIEPSNSFTPNETVFRSISISDIINSLTKILA